MKLLNKFINMLKLRFYFANKSIFNNGIWKRCYYIGGFFGEESAFKE